MRFVRFGNRVINMEKVSYVVESPSKPFRGEDWEPETMTNDRVEIYFDSTAGDLDESGGSFEMPVVVLTNDDAKAFFEWMNRNCQTESSPRENYIH